MKMSNEEISSNKIEGILEPDEPCSFELKLAGGVVKVELTFKPREADRIIAIEGLGKPSKISYLCSFKDISVSNNKRKENK